MSTFLHVAVGFVGKVLEPEEVQKAFATGAGWARYAPNCWIVVTDESRDVLRDRLRAICSEHDSIFICELKIETASGYLQKEIWEWISTNGTMKR